MSHNASQFLPSNIEKWNYAEIVNRSETGDLIAFGKIPIGGRFGVDVAVRVVFLGGGNLLDCRLEAYTAFSRDIRWREATVCLDLGANASNTEKLVVDRLQAKHALANLLCKHIEVNDVLLTELKVVYWNFCPIFVLVFASFGSAEAVAWVVSDKETQP